MMEDKSRQRSETYFAVLQTLSVFRRQIAVAPRSLRRMFEEWSRAYKGRFSDRLDRFDKETQVALLLNWEKLLDHVDRAHDRLLRRLREKEAEVRSLRADVSANSCNRVLHEHKRLTRQCCRSPTPGFEFWLLEMDQADGSLSL
jgi:hypothetical protein